MDFSFSEEQQEIQKLAAQILGDKVTHERLKEIEASPEWFDRDKTGFSDPALPAGVLGLLTLLIVPVQVLLIAFAMRGFQQGWNVEVEVPAGETYHPERHQPRTA
jgi:hypothetical protein